MTQGEGYALYFNRGISLIRLVHSCEETDSGSLFNNMAVATKYINVLSLKRPSFPRLFDPTRKLGQMRGHNQLICKDSLSWTELSSLSSAIISTKSEPNKSRIGSHAAQRDYRFQSYKCPENFVLPQLTNQVEKSNLASDNIKKSVAEPTIGVDKCTNKWSSVSEELQNNRLFVSAQIELARQ